MRLTLALLLAALLLIVPTDHTSAQTAPEDAAAVVAIFQAQGLPIGETRVFTAENDPNKLLGRPGGYTSKVSWRDPRVEDVLDEIRVDSGGGVEMYADAAGATRRAEYISRIVQASSLFTEYTYTQGRIVLRLSRDLTPAQAEEYHAVLAELAG